MKIKLSLFLALSLTGFFAVNLLLSNESKAFTETKTGSVNATYGTNGGDQADLFSLWLGSQSTIQESLGYFQERFLVRVIEQLGTNNYPVTYKFLTAALAAKPTLNDPDAWGPILLADECTLERKGILNCLSGTGDIGHFNGQIWKLDANIDPILYFLVNRPDLIEMRTRGMNVSYPSYGELKTIPDEIAKLKTTLTNSNPAVLEILNWSGVWGPDILTFTAKIGGLSCSHTNKYNYNFEYDVSQDSSWKLLSSTTVHKCENIKLVFNPNAEWVASLTCGRENSYTFKFASPPTNILNCSGQDDCLSKATEYTLTTDTFGKGVQKVPADFVDQTQKSLNSSDTHMQCADGVCKSFTSGIFPLSSTAPATSYFGQCRGFGLTVNTPEAVMPAVTSNTTVTIANQPPVPAISFAKNPIDTNEEVSVTCDIVDPDECSDKIAQIKWSCQDSSGNAANCAFWRQGTQQWISSSITNDIVSSEQENPYHATVKFRATTSGNYAVTCKATDNDANNPLSGTGIASITVNGNNNCNADGVCNQSCPYDPDCCQDKTYYDSHTQCSEACLTPNGVCNMNCPYDPDCCKDKTYSDSHSQCGGVVDAGSCVTIRTKPSLDINTVKPFEEVKYQANVLGGSNPIGFIWYCDKDTNVSSNHTTSSRSDNQSCTYADEKNYEPKTLYQYKDKTGNVKSQECVNAQDIGVNVSNGEKAAVSCNVSVNSLKINEGDTVTAKIVTKPSDVQLDKLMVTWKVNGQTTILKGNQPLKTQLNKAGITTIEASVKNSDDTAAIDCQSASINVKGIVHWGQQ